MSSPNIIAILPAAGTGTRVGDARPKQYLDLGGRPMIAHAINVLSRIPRISRIVVVLSPLDTLWSTLMAGETRVETLAVGGVTRGESVRNALRALSATCLPDDWMLVHDAARCLVRPEWVDRLIDAFEPDRGHLVTVPVAEGRRGNPVLWSRRFFNELMTLDGDTGARHLIAKHAEAVAEVAVEGESAFLDIDTPQGLEAARRG